MKFHFQLRFSMNFAIFSAKFCCLFAGISQRCPGNDEMCQDFEKSAREENGKMPDVSGICEKFHFLSTGYLSARLTCPLALGRARALTMDGGARGCDRTRLCNLSPSKRQHSRREEKPKTGEAVKNCRNGTLRRAEAFPTADCPNIYIAYAHPFPR